MLLNLENLNTNWKCCTEQKTNLFQTYQKNIFFLMAQHLMPGFGASYGECYGLVMTYAEYRRSKNRAPFKFTAEASILQDKQLIKNSPNQTLFPKRLTSARYQPDLKKQIQAILYHVEQNKGTPLACMLYARQGGHATYFEYTTDNKWHFFDPNRGAFKFDKKEELVHFYQELYANGRLQWHTYHIEKLLTEPPANTWAGKLRSILTGPRYYAGISAEYYLAHMLIGVAAVSLGVGAFIALTYFSPIIIPTSLIVVIGCSVACGAAIFGRILAHHIMRAGFRGLLAIPNFLHYQFLVSKKYHIEQKSLDITEENSFSKIIRALPDRHNLDEELPREKNSNEPELHLRDDLNKHTTGQATANLNNDHVEGEKSSLKDDEKRHLNNPFH